MGNLLEKLKTKSKRISWAQAYFICEKSKKENICARKIPTKTAT
jgi:hypothetical protein